MRKICLTALLSILLICAVAISVSAAGEFEINAVAISAQPGGAIVVEVTVDDITADTGLESVDFILSYSSNVTYSSVSATLPAGWEMWNVVSNTTARTLKLAAVDEGANPNPVKTNGAIKFTITFGLSADFSTTDSVDISFAQVGGSRGGSYAYVEGIGNAYSYAKYPVSIEVTKLPAKKTYVAGQKFFSNGMTVAVNYNDGTSEAITDYTVTAPDMTQDGVIPVLVEWQGFETTFNITINLGTLDSLTVTPPAKTEYVVGDTLDTSGMTVIANYANSVTRDVTDKVSVNTTTLTTAGAVTVTVTYEGKTATFTVTVEEAEVPVELTGIEVKAPTKTSYVVGETLNTAGMTVMAVYTDGSKVDVTAEAEVDTTALEATGTVTVTVTYEGKTATFTVTVTAGKEFLGTNLNLGNALDINFAFYTKYVDSTGYAKIVRSYANKDESTTIIPLGDCEVRGSGASTYYFIKYAGIAAKEMCDQIKISVYDANGNQISETRTDSVRDYSVRMVEKELNKATPKEKTVRLYVDMLNYGAAAQNYFNYNEEDLANSTLTEAQKAYGTQDDPTCNNQLKTEGSASAAYKGTQLVLESNINIRFAMLTSSIKGCTAELSFVDHNGKTITRPINIADCETQSNGAITVFEVNDIVVADGRALINLVICDADGNEIIKLVDSMESYVQRKASSNPLFYEIMKFSDAAYNYFH